MYRFKFFNPIQTQVFFSLYQTNKNILIGAPTGSGKTIMSELAVLHQLKEEPDKKIVYIAPLKALVKERLKDWEPRFKKIKKSVVELSGDFTPDIESLKKADIITTTPEKWDGITRSKEREYTQKVGLVIFDEIHLLGQERGAVLEVIVSRMNKERKVRMVGLSTAMANGTDVAEWFGTDTYGFFNFRPSVRPVPV
jgi:activating signal cointegrator complex subunit 3